MNPLKNSILFSTTADYQAQVKNNSNALFHLFKNVAQDDWQRVSDTHGPPTLRTREGEGMHKRDLLTVQRSPPLAPGAAVIVVQSTLVRPGVAMNTQFPPS